MKKIITAILILFCASPAFASKNVKSIHPKPHLEASIIQDRPVESASYYAAKGDKILNYYEKLEVKSDSEKYLNAAKYFYYQANRIDISNADALIGRARIALFQNKIRDAKNNLFIALNYNENNPKVTYYLGETFFQDGDYDEAIKFYTEAYNHGYKLNYKTNLKLGICYEKLDDVKKAKYHYQNAVKIMPSQAEPRMRLQGLDVINTNYETYDIFKKNNPDDEELPLTEEELKSLSPN